jgi:hypothetical protein
VKTTLCSKMRWSFILADEVVGMTGFVLMLHNQVTEYVSISMGPRVRLDLFLITSNALAEHIQHGVLQSYFCH